VIARDLRNLCAREAFRKTIVRKDAIDSRRKTKDVFVCRAPLSRPFKQKLWRENTSAAELPSSEITALIIWGAASGGP